MALSGQCQVGGLVGPWQRASQARREAWRVKYNHALSPRIGRANLLGGLACCPFCGRNMVLLGGKPNWRYYMCRLTYSGAGCSDQWVRYPGIETALTIDIEAVIRGCPKPALTSEARSHMLQEIRSRLYVLRGRQATMTQEHAMLRQSMRPLREEEEAVEAEIKRLLAERKRLRIDRPKWLDVALAKRLDQLQLVAGASPVDLKALHALLTLLFSKVAIDWPKETLCIHWKHGGQSTVKAAMKPLREFANPRRSARPRFQPGERAPPLPAVPR